MDESKRDAMVAIGQLEEGLAHAQKLAEARGLVSASREEPSQKDELSARIAETNLIRDAVGLQFKGYGYPESDLANLAFDISEFHEACRAYLERVGKLLAERERNPDLVGVQLATIEAGLRDARSHIEDLLTSLPKFYSFLADSGGDDSEGN